MKKRLRIEMRHRLLAMPEESAAAKSRAAVAALLGLPEFARCGVVMSYMPIRGEVDTGGLALSCWQTGKTLLVPRVIRDTHELQAIRYRPGQPTAPAAYSIQEPTDGEPWPIDQIDLIIVPAVAYDRRGYRLGKGGGYYDRLLSRPELRALTCGLAFAEQVLPEVPVFPHDRPIDLVVSDREVLRFAPRRPLRAGTEE